jgi:tRNA nucleotidyltransferase/poly(A) polymerase
MLNKLPTRLFGIRTQRSLFSAQNSGLSKLAYIIFSCSSCLLRPDLCIKQQNRSKLLHYYFENCVSILITISLDPKGLALPRAQYLIHDHIVRQRMTTRRTLMSGLAFLVQPFAATAPRSTLFSSSSFLGTQFGGADLMKPLTTHRFICYAQFGNTSNRPFSSASTPLLAGAPAAAAASAASGGNRESSLASSSPRKSPRKTAPRRRKPKFANDYVEAAAAAADLLDLSKEHDDEINTNNNNLALNSFEKSSSVHNHNQRNHHEQSTLMDSADVDKVDTAKESFYPSKTLVFEDDAHPIREHLISGAAWTVLLRLRSAGHETYIVGGTVRDMLLNNTPKDYDILTSAEPSEIEYLFPRAFVLGRSFPICHVHHDNEIIEVSSFSTNADPSRIPLDVAAMMTLTGREIRTSSGSSSRRGSSKASDSSGSASSKRGGRRGGKLSSFPHEEEMYDEDEVENAENGGEALIASGSKLMKRGGPTWSTARRDNAIKRDFRVNGLLYDPFSRILYDYVGGTADCTARILRTMGSPTHSFSQDPARILRAVRLAARVELTIEKTTSEAMMSMAVATAKLPQGRLQMELAAMFTHGAALPAMKLLWRYGLLDMLLPHHAVMLSKQHVPRKQDDEEDDEHTLLSSSTSPSTSTLNEFDANTVLFALLAELDKTTSSCKPAETAVWVTAIAAPLVAQECQRVVERRVAAKLRKQRREEQEDEEELGSSSSSSNEWYDVEEIDALLASNRKRNEIKTTKTATATATAPAASSNGSKNDLVATDVLPSSPEYLEIYGRIVDKVMAKLLSKPDAKTQKHLARIAPFAVPLNSGGGVKRKKKPSQGGNGDSSNTTESISTNSTTVPAVPVLSCVLPRQAVEAARSYLKLEALLRGQELDYSSAMNDKQGRGGGSAGGKKRSGAQQPRHVGRSKKGGRGRKLAANEYAVLQLLRASSVQWVQATQLAISDEEEE